MGSEGASALRARVEDLIAGFSGRVGVSADNLTTGDRLQINETELFPALSTVKLAIMAELFRRVHGGELSLDEQVQVRGEDLRGGTGIVRELDTPLTLTLKDVCMLMIVVSDNTCTAMLARKLGKVPINECMRSLGLSQIELRADIGADIFDTFGPENLEAFAASSPGDLTSLTTMIARGELFSQGSCDQMLDIMGRCQHIEYLGRYLPVDPFAAESGSRPEARLANKLGAYLHGRCDVGLIESPKSRYVLTVMTADSADASMILPVHEGAEVIGLISKAIYNAWGGSPGTG